MELFTLSMPRCYERNKALMLCCNQQALEIQFVLFIKTGPVYVYQCHYCKTVSYNLRTANSVIKRC